MLTDDATPTETIFVTARGQVIDCVSFADALQAAAYKRDVRRWALDRNVIVHLITEVTGANPCLAHAS